MASTLLAVTSDLQLAVVCAQQLHFNFFFFITEVSRRHGGHRERIFTEPVMDLLLQQLGQHYYRIRDHLEKPQAVVMEIADYINSKVLSSLSLFRTTYKYLLLYR